MAGRFEKEVVFFVLVFSLSIVCYSSLVSADIISVNPAGSTEFVLTTDKYVEGFFFGIPEEEEPDDDDTDDGDGGAGGGAGGEITDANIVVDPTSFEEELLINTNVDRVIKVTNVGGTEATVSVSYEELDNMVILGEDSLTISSGETVDLGVTFVAPGETGTYTGKIIVGDAEVLVTLNVREGVLLFDSSIVVLNPDSTVVQGDQLETLISLIPMGDPTRLDVTLNFAIRDFSNNVHSTSSETLLVEERMSLDRDFNTGNLPPGTYVIGMELVYPGGVAPSSAQFTVVEREFSPLVGKIILFLIILILIIAIIILIILIWRKRKEDKEKARQGQQGQQQLFQRPY
ncbi:MAG: hypothetical protein WDZ69_01750 [Candidatus Pacearchaeota archaeon]